MKLFYKSLTNALKGIQFGLKERHMKFHLLFAILVIAAGWYFHLTTTEWCIVLICIGGVWSLELINTAIEYFVDLIEPNYHPVAGKIKDIAAGAVLVFSIISAIIGTMIFWKYVVTLFSLHY